MTTDIRPDNDMPADNPLTSDASPAAEIKNIVFTYTAQSDAAAINDVSFQVRKGECLLLTGISGCGKTSIVRTINGLIPNYYEGVLTGTVEIWGEPAAGKPIYDISKKVSTVFQNPKSQFFNLDTTSEILFFLENTGTPFEKMHERLRFVSQFLHIEHLLDRNIFNLSGGEKQMVAIASALASDTDIIVFDEPTSNLDIGYIEKITEALHLLKKAGKTLIISEHRLHFLRELVDRVLLIKDGKIEREFSQKEFTALSEQSRKELLLRPITMDSRVFEKPDASGSASMQTFGFNHTPEPAKSESGTDFAHKTAADTQTAQLTIERLTYRFPKGRSDFLSVQNVTMDFGKVIALTGKNGQGKSTFAQCLTGLLKTKKDSVFLNGKKTNAKKRLELSYMVLQDVGYQLFTESVEDEIALGKNKKISAEQKAQRADTAGGTPTAEAVLKAMHLTELKDKHPLSLSGGQKQRVSIGAAVSSGARIIIMDEPTSGMDYFHMKETAALINAYRASDRLILIISHDFEFLTLVADELLLMEKGTIASQSAFTAAQAEKVFEQLRVDEGRGYRGDGCLFLRARQSERPCGLGQFNPKQNNL
ncbi:ABC transporter ATP-binding protein [Treponema lecithinolyticum]|uniref:ABC transporter, ATP-binding protein n=1 Tax=Treponema lecithinolyticum ATCC 700332 TaxID=1321815 RepID=A0ABN0NYL2_TRELE|nr:ABC transporter ATP-binding protein [Treponema lecithinolyticum]ERJ93099.1 ABC transporter, ATP-binding protein [Treponema lecithinolyticum ATCC 700332]